MPDAVIIVDKSGKIVQTNVQAERLFGYTRQEMLVQTVEMLVPEQFRSLHTEERTVYAASPRIRSMGTGVDLRARRKGGSEFPVDISLSPMETKEGLLIMAVIRDMTEWERLRRFTENMLATVPSGLVAIGKKSEVLSVNRSFCELFGLTREQVEGKPVDVVLRTIELSEECRNAVVARKPFRNVECTCSLPGKGTVTLQLTLSGIRLAEEEEEEEEELLLVIDDITERKRAEEELKKFSRVVEQTADNVFITNRDGIIEYVNPAFEKLTGYTKQEVIGKTPEILKSGKQDREFYRKLWEMILSGRVFRAEFVNKKKNGELYYETKTITPIVDAHGNITHFVSSSKDITEQRKLEEQFRQAQKMESIGTLASGIAHDFNNILGIILGHATLLERLKTDPEKFSQSVDTITKVIQRGASLVKQLLTFARKTEAIFQPVNINDIIGEITKLLAETFPKTITISTSLQPELPLVTADGSQIHQVLTNLCINARDAMPKGGTLSIASNTVEGEAVSVRFPEARLRRARQYVQIKVADTGLGMDEATRERIFEPFFTTKEIGKGTGLGLSVVFGIIEDHNGFIDVRSALGEGTSFTVYLPVPEDSPVVSQPIAQVVQSIPGGTETILLIEDEEMLSELVKAVLVSKGYTMLTANDGPSGIEMYQRHHNEIALVLSDLGLPIVSGQEVFRRIREINSNAKIILASGFIEPETKSEMYKAGLKEFIQKPYHADEVLQKVRDVIDIQR